MLLNVLSCAKFYSYHLVPVIDVLYRRGIQTDAHESRSQIGCNLQVAVQENWGHGSLERYSELLKMLPSTSPVRNKKVVLVIDETVVLNHRLYLNGVHVAVVALVRNGHRDKATRMALYLEIVPYAVRHRAYVLTVEERHREYGVTLKELLVDKLYERSERKLERDLPVERICPVPKQHLASGSAFPVMEGKIVRHHLWDVLRP